MSVLRRRIMRVMATMVTESVLYDLGSSTVRALQSAQAARRRVSVAASLSDLEAAILRAIEVSEQARHRWRALRRIAPGSIPEPLFEEIRLVCQAGVVLVDRIRSTVTALDASAMPTIPSFGKTSPRRKPTGRRADTSAKSRCGGNSLCKR